MIDAILGVANLGRVLSRDVTEGPAEGAEALPTCLEGDLDDGQIRVAEQGAGALDASAEEVAVRRQAEGGFEGPGEVSRRDTADRGELNDCPRLLRGTIHPVLCAKKPSHQCWIEIRHVIRPCRRRPGSVGRWSLLTKSIPATWERSRPVPGRPAFILDRSRLHQNRLVEATW